MTDQPTRAQLRETHAGVTALDLLLAGAAAETAEELDTVAHLCLTVLGHVGCLQRIHLPDGREVASLHAHIAGWRHRGLVGFTTRETYTSGRLARPP